MNLTRRAFIKANAAASAAAVAGISLPAGTTNLIVDTDKTKISWDKRLAGSVVPDAQCWWVRKVVV